MKYVKKLKEKKTEEHIAACVFGIIILSHSQMPELLLYALFVSPISYRSLIIDNNRY